jgi:Flp pilus assembly protein TadD
VQGEEAAVLETSLGEMYEATGKTVDAGQAFRRALAKNKKTVGAIAGLARTLWVAQDQVTAIELLRKGVQEFPREAVLYTELGVAYLDYRVPDRARDALQKAIELDPTQARAYPPLLTILEGDAKQGKEYYEILGKAAKATPDDLDLQLRYAEAAYKKGDNINLLKAAARVVAIKPNHGRGNFLLGLAQFKAGDETAAASTLDALDIAEPEMARELALEIEKLRGKAEVREAAEAKPKPAAPKKKKRKKKR